ncbi:hypothetical protein WN943_007526 [Citrus x changshan-huyou]
MDANEENDPDDGNSMDDDSEYDSVSVDSRASLEEKYNMEWVSSPGFKSSFKTRCKIYKPDIVAILEPKVSGAKADYFIKGSGFEFSHRVEAEGFVLSTDDDMALTDDVALTDEDYFQPNRVTVHPGQTVLLFIHVVKPWTVD